jgi:hypothetical protein
MGHSRRKKLAARGDVCKPSVAAGNKMVARMALLLALCYAKSLGWALEQPVSSFMVYHPAMLYLCSRVRSLGLHWWQVSTFMGAFNGETLKPHVLYGNEGWLKALERCHPGKLKKHSSVGVVNKWVDASGRKRCAGGSALKGTQTYTREFGEAVAGAFTARDNPILRGQLHNYGQDEMDNVQIPTFDEAWQDLGLQEILDALEGWSPVRWVFDPAAEHLGQCSTFVGACVALHRLFSATMQRSAMES